MNPLDELKRQMETPEFAESARKYMEEYFGRMEKNKEKVSSKEYIDWIYNYVSDNKQVDEESAALICKGIDSENGKILGTFLDYVKDLAIQQRVLVIQGDKYGFDSEQVVINIKDRYFELFRMYGQGSWTSINLMDKNPGYAYVKL